MNILRQPEGSSLCGQTCVAMASGVSLDRACEAVGHRNGTTTKEIVKALRELGVPCGEKLKRISRKRPALPKRGIVAICQPGKRYKWHWILVWDGEMIDPAGLWPKYYDKWKMTSFLEIGGQTALSD